MAIPHHPIITAEELLLDERFLAWVGAIDDPLATEWIESLRKVSEEQQDEILDAWMIYHSVRLEESDVSGMAAQRDRLMERLQRETEPTNAAPASGRRRSWRVPATVLLLLLLGFGGLLYMYSSSDSTVLTGDGKLAKLADGTAVTLKSNSTITYADGFEAKKVREVWVSGEAHFSVTHKKEDQPFVVHAGLFDIKVTGTRFIVNSDPEQASVLLQEGSVHLIFPGGEVVNMKPGDYFTLSAGRDGLATTALRTPASLERHIVFENTPFEQVVREIERRYEVDVKVLTPGLQDKLISGILPNNDLSVLLRALESAMDCLITQEKSTLFIQKSL